MSQVVWDIVIVLLIILVGGFFAAAEMALVSLREGQIRVLSQGGRRGQRAAKLAQDPNRFLAAVQIGVTLATLINGAFGEATLAGHLRTALVHHNVAASVASVVSLIVVSIVISYFTLVLGELAPKRLALQRAEQVSLIVAPTLDRVAVLARPLVWALSRSTNLVVRILGGDPRVNRGVMTEEELHDLVAGNQALSPDERRIVGEVFDAGKRRLREVLVPRTEVEFLPAGLSLREAAAVIGREPYSRFPVYRESYDDVIGFIHVRDLLDPEAIDGSRTVEEILRPVKLLPISKTVLSALSEMRRDRAHLAIVMDEYGGTAGIVTLEDLVEELIGDIQDEYDVDEGQPKQLRGGAVEVDGLLNLDEFAEQTGIELPEGPYETVAGFLLAALGQLPTDHESVEVAGHRLTVLELDGRRIARLRVDPIGPPGDAEPAAGAGGAGAPAVPGTSVVSNPYGPAGTGGPAVGAGGSGSPASGPPGADGSPADAGSAGEDGARVVPAGPDGHSGGTPSRSRTGAD